MRAFSLIIFKLLVVGTLFAQAPAEVIQENIVPNPGFEKYSGTPIGWFYKGKHYTSVMKYWSSATAASPDVFGPKVRVPSQWAEKGFGDQTARSGKSMTGITSYGCEDGKPHCREYIQIQLKEPLVPGQNYLGEFWVSHLPRSMRANNLAMYFSKKPIGLKTDAPIALTPQIFAEQIVSCNGNSWMKISGTFTAEEECEYLTIGNFCPDSLTESRSVHHNSLNYAYYYVDDVSVRKMEPIINVPIKEDDLSKIVIEEGKVVTLKNIFFDTDKSELLPRSYVELKKLLRLMDENPTMVIEVSGHTDNVGNFNYNMDLSRRRAEAVVDYLNRYGIHPNRTLFRGNGNTLPIASNDSEEGRQLNRRVEFLIIRK